MTPKPPAPTFTPNRTLSTFFPRQLSLLDLLASLFASDPQLLRHGDDASYVALLHETSVCLGSQYKERRWEESEPLEVRMIDVINKAVATIFASSRGRPSNQLTNGFASSAYGNSSHNPQRPGIHVKFINTNHNVFLLPEWKLLISRIGAEPFHHLLTTTSLFLLLENGCRSQITGTPLTDLKPLEEPSAEHSKKQTKRKGGADEDIDNEVGRKRKKRKRGAKRKLEMEKAVTGDVETRMRDYVLGDDGLDQVDRDVEMVKAQPEQKKRPLGPVVKVTTPADLRFSRSSMLYGRPERRCRDDNILQKLFVVGLPQSHILSRLSPSHSQYALALSSAALQLVLMHVFPRQFSLPSPFAAPPPMILPFGRSPPLPTLDEAIIKERERRRGSFKTPNGRMKGKLLKDLMGKMAKNAGECDFWKLRARWCPSTIETKVKSQSVCQSQLDEEADVTMQLDFVSQPPPSSQPNATQRSSHSIPSSSLKGVFHSQAPPSSLDVSHRSLIVPHGADVASSKTKKKRRFADFTQSHSQVGQFAKAAIKQIVPLELFGSESNRLLILRHVDRFVSLRRFETFTLHYVVQGFCMTDCRWLEPDRFVKDSRLSVGDARKRQELVEEFIWWLFEGLLIPLLKTNFYITESGAYKQQVFYFRHDDWDTACRPIVLELQASAYEKLSQEDLLYHGGQRRQLTHSYVRLLPKEFGVRPIINLKRMPVASVTSSMSTGQRWGGSGGKTAKLMSVNSTLKEVFEVLVLKKISDSTTFGSSILSPDDIYPKLKDFKARTIVNCLRPPPFYFVKVDVRSCYDTIDQTKLSQILTKLFEEDDAYNVMRYSRAKMADDRFIRRFILQAFYENDEPTFPELAEDLAKRVRNSIMMDKTYHTVLGKSDALKLLREHITNNLIKIGKDYYRQAKGIPQGSIVSSHLCSFFYADLEKKHLGFTDSPDSMLVRMIDDFLLVTTDRLKASRFLRSMHAGHPEYGCFVSREKTLVNFECKIADEDAPSVTSSIDFPWCGRLINTRDLSIKGDYTREIGHIRNALTVDLGRNPGLQIRQKAFTNLSLLRASISFNDTNLNPPRIVYLNIYQNLLFCAMKTLHHIAAVEGECVGEKREGFLLDLVKDAGPFVYQVVKNGEKSEMAVRYDAKVDVEGTVVSWLAYTAFHKVFSCKPTLFRKTDLVRRLAEEVSRTGMVDRGAGTMRAEEPLDLGVVWGGVIEEGWKGMAKVRF